MKLHRVCATAAMLTAAALLEAATPHDAAADPVPEPAIADIVVTANRREERLQQTAGAVSAITGDELARSGAVDLTDLSNVAPGLLVNESAGEFKTITIRGLGNLAFQGGGTSSVATHFDGVYLQSPFALNAEFLDLDRIEVLRGPQGPTHGQNSTGGAVNFISNQPKLDKASGSVGLAYGNYNLVHFDGVFNAPVTDELAVRVAVGYLRHDGFGEAKNVPGEPNFGLDDDNSTTARTSVLWRPSENFSLTATAFIYNLDANARELKNINDPLTDPRQTSSDYASPFKIRSQIYSVTANWDVGPLSLSSISSWQLQQRSAPVNNDGLNFALASVYNPAPVQGHDIVPSQAGDERSITQEVDVALRPDVVRGLRLFSGVFFQDYLQKGKYAEYQVANASSPILPIEFLNAGNVFRYIGNGFEVQTHNTLKQYSVFAQADYDLFPWLTVTTGVRYNSDESQGANSAYFGKITPIDQSDHAFTGKAQLDFKITPDNHIAIGWATGFKPGGTNIVPGTVQNAILVPAAYQPEENTAYEINSKNEFFDKRLRLNFSAYYYDYTGLQFPEEDPLPFFGGTGSIPKAHIEGLEGELGVVLPNNVRLDGSAALQYGRIDSSLLALDPVVSNGLNVSNGAAGFGLFSPQNVAARSASARNIKGNPIPQLPLFSGQLGVSHTLEIGDDAILTSRVSVNYHTSYNYRVEANANTDKVGPAAILNLDFRYEPLNARWAAELQFLNITNRAALTSRNTDQFGVGATTVTYVRPFQAIGRVSYKF